MRRVLTIWLLLAAVAVLAAAYGLVSGAAGLGWIESVKALVDPANPDHGWLLVLRAKRVSDAFAVGALLAFSGALLQVLLRNPMAEPYILGLSGGAAVGALMAIVAAAAPWVISASAMSGAIVSLLLLLALAHREFRGLNPAAAGERLILTGLMLAAFWGAVVSITLSIAPIERVHALIFWLMGDLSSASGAGLPWYVVAVLLVCVMAIAPQLNLLAHGEEHAAALGVNVARVKWLVVVMSAMGAATAVSMAGTIGFVGLVTPHAVRLCWGNDQRMLIPAAMLLGGAFTVVADTLARTMLAPEQLPVGALTAAIGAPLFLYMLWRRRT
jgi:iron complex transport system permease protein